MGARRVIREVLPGIHWIQECGPDRQDLAPGPDGGDAGWNVPGRPIHVPQNAYLVRGERTLLLDTLSPAGTHQILPDLDAALGGRQLDFLVVSHPDVPHAGNTATILRRHPGAQLVAPAMGHTHALYHLEDARKVAPGDRIDLGGLSVVFEEATFLDAPLSIWMREEMSNTLFTVDWLGFPHLGGECLRCVEELDADITPGRLIAFHARVMFWLQYVDVVKTQSEIDRLIRNRAPDAIAPSHGLVIRAGATDLMARMKEVVAQIASGGRLGVL